MADDSVVVVVDDESKIVTKFLLNTCRLRQPSLRYLHAVSWCSVVHPTNAGKFRRIPLMTGSTAELYIQPMLSCVCDVDIMVHQSDWLIIPEGYSPPTELPAEFHSRVEVYEIRDSEYPGYVYLMRSYLLTEDSQAGKYNAISLHCDQRYYALRVLCNERDTTVKIHGPALITSHALIDYVPCIRCLSWPPQAADWPTRHRNYDWPDSATVDRVVNNGCDVVYVVHPMCRQDEWMSMRQWRLSFSRAEIVLLNSWMPVQQIVYHMLRFFVKTERLTDITDSTGTKILSNYHFKTLMMWACEQKPQSWWIDDMNVVRVGIKLLHILADLLNKKTVHIISLATVIYFTIHIS